MHTAQRPPGRDFDPERDPFEIGETYRVLEPIGAGGFSTVYLCENRSKDLVAVKLIDRNLAERSDIRGRFQREVEQAQRVRSDFTVIVLEFAAGDTGELWMAMEYADGPNLDWARKEIVLSDDLILSIADRTARGLQDIHRAEIIHRDLNPSNVVLLSSDPGLKIIDFGISRDDIQTGISRDDIQTPTTRTGTLVGTPGFWSPEHFRGLVRPESDVYCWALTVCFAASGRSPIDGWSGSRILSESPDPPPELPSRLYGTVRKALCVEPYVRPTVGEIIEELSDISAHAWHYPPELQQIPRGILEPPASQDQSPQKLSPTWTAVLMLAIAVVFTVGYVLFSRETDLTQTVPEAPPTTLFPPPTTLVATPSTPSVSAAPEETGPDILGSSTSEGLGEKPPTVSPEPPQILTDNYLWGPSKPAIALQSFLGLPANGLYDSETFRAHVSALLERGLPESLAPKPPAALAPAGGLIAFSTSPEDDWFLNDIWVMNPDGGDLRNVTECTNEAGRDCESEVSATWSPDGTQIAYSHTETGGGISVINVDGTGRRQLLEEPHAGWDTRWSPDGLEIAFTSHRDSAATASSTCYDSKSVDDILGAMMSCPRNLFLLNTVSGEIRQLTEESAQVGDPDWSPSGDQLAFAADRGPGSEIFVINRDGTDLRQLTDNARNDFDPRWNPTGDAIAYWGQELDLYGSNPDDNDFEIWLTDLDRNVVQITDNSVDDLHPRWSPDGTQLIFERERGGDRSDRETLIWENGSVRHSDRALHGAWWVPDPTPSPDAITMTTFPAVDQIFFDDGGCSIMNPDGTNRRDFGVACGWSAALSPDGRHIAYAGNRPRNENGRLGDRSIFIMDWTGNNVRQVTFEPLDIGMNLVWSPDSTKIAFKGSEQVIQTMNADGTGIASTGQMGMPFSWHDDLIAFTGLPIMDIFVMNSDGTDVRRLTDNGYLNHQPQFSPDGRSIAFSSDRDGNREIYVMDADGSDVRRITDSPSWDWMPVWSPDGKRIAFGSDFYNPPFEDEIFITDASGINTIGGSWFYTGQSGEPWNWAGPRNSALPSLLPPTGVAIRTAPELVAELGDAVWKVEANGCGRTQTGSAFVIDSRHLITDTDIVSIDSTPLVRSRDGRTLEGTVIGGTHMPGVAVVEVDEHLGDPLVWVEPDFFWSSPFGHEYAQEIVALGYSDPAGGIDFASSTIEEYHEPDPWVSAVWDRESSEWILPDRVVHAFLSNEAIGTGWSGGPVLTGLGQVAGMVAELVRSPAAPVDGINASLFYTSAYLEEPVREILSSRPGYEVDCSSVTAYPGQPLNIKVGELDPLCPDAVSRIFCMFSTSVNWDPPKDDPDSAPVAFYTVEVFLETDLDWVASSRWEYFWGTIVSNTPRSEDAQLILGPEDVEWALLMLWQDIEPPFSDHQYMVTVTSYSETGVPFRDYTDPSASTAFVSVPLQVDASIMQAQYEKVVLLGDYTLGTSASTVCPISHLGVTSDDPMYDALGCGPSGKKGVERLQALLGLQAHGVYDGATRDAHLAELEVRGLWPIPADS